MPQPAPDYRELLLLYIQHVIRCEGADFIDSGGYRGDIVLTDDQISTLHELKAEGNARDDRGELPTKP